MSWICATTFVFPYFLFGRYFRLGMNFRLTCMRVCERMCVCVIRYEYLLRDIYSNVLNVEHARHIRIQTPAHIHNAPIPAHSFYGFRYTQDFTRAEKKKIWEKKIVNIRIWGVVFVRNESNGMDGYNKRSWQFIYMEMLIWCGTRILWIYSDECVCENPIHFDK